MEMEKITESGTCFFNTWSAGDELLAFCKKQAFSTYVYTGPNGAMEKWIGPRPLKRAPKVEFYLTDDVGGVEALDGKLRPVYRWGQSEKFKQAGYPMPPFLRDLASRINREFGERVNHCILIWYAHGTEQHAVFAERLVPCLPLIS